MEAHDFLGISFLGNETFSTPESTAECANPTHTLWHQVSVKKNICSHFLPNGAAPELITADVTQEERGRASFPTPTCHGLCLSSPLLCFCPGLTKSSRLFLSDPHPSPNSWTHGSLALDHRVLIAALAGYLGQMAESGLGRGAEGRVVWYHRQNNFTHCTIVAFWCAEVYSRFPYIPSTQNQSWLLGHQTVGEKCPKP